MLQKKIKNKKKINCITYLKRSSFKKGQNGRGVLETTQRLNFGPFAKLLRPLKYHPHHILSSKFWIVRFTIRQQMTGYCIFSVMGINVSLIIFYLAQVIFQIDCFLYFFGWGLKHLVEPTFFIPFLGYWLHTTSLVSY